MARVPETSNRLIFDEPITLWRMQRPDGRRAHAMLGPRAGGAAVVVWFVNNRPIGFRDFDDWTRAVGWSDQLQAQNWAAGWRLAPES